jgi:prepilin-type N-terminal cleavage/methylation domain-containing protein
MKPWLRRSFKTRGVTLIELIIGAAIAAIILTASSFIMVSMTKMRREARTRMERLSEVFSGLTVMERNFLNAGFHYPSARFAFSVANNVTTGAIGGYNVADPCTSGTCIVPGTDVVEVAQGTDSPFFTVDSINAGTPPVVVGQFLGGPLPAANTTEQRLIFVLPTLPGVGGAPQSCIAKLASGGLSIAAPTISAAATMLDIDGSTLSGTYLSNYGQECPRVGMLVGALDQRFRYMSMVTAAGDYGLYRQILGPTGTQVSFIELVGGVDNFQVVPLVRNPGTLCTGAFCECHTPAGTCSLDYTLKTSPQFALANQVVGARVTVSSRGVLTQTLDNTNAVVRDRLADEPAFASDRLVRTVQSQTYMFRNFTQVQP